MASSMSKVRRAEQRLVVAAPRVSTALDEMREALDDPFGHLSVAGHDRYAVQRARDELSQAARHLVAALELLHDMEASKH